MPTPKGENSRSYASFFSVKHSMPTQSSTPLNATNTPT